MEAHEQFMAESFRVSFFGPFTHHKVVVDGWEVPLIEAELQGEDRVLLTVDRRYGVELTTDEAERIVPFLAQAMAVALGFPCHPRSDAEPPLGQVPHLRPRRVWDVAPVEREAR
jgi:hypothetical protein